MANKELEKFLKKIEETDQRPPIVRVFHAVRNIPYGSTGVRDPLKVILENRGSCTGKHLLLRDLLRAQGFTTEIITMFTYFNEGIPIVDSYPPELKRLCGEERIPDFHHYARVWTGDRWVKLDATWHDRLIPFGFAVNTDWAGDGDTALAAVPIKEYPNVEDLISRKKELVRSLKPEDREKRARFFRLVTMWIASLE